MKAQSMTRAEIVDWWDDTHRAGWLFNMRHGAAETTAADDYGDSPDARVALISEQRWRPTPAGHVPSRLWDAATPTSCGGPR